MENKVSTKLVGDSKGLVDSVEKGDKSLEKLGITAKQTAAAMRGVPAQFTDIITSLQGGQAPITVLFQQGGQLKDMFGGVGNAARALGGYVLGLINPFTLTAAAAGTLGAAFFYGSEQSKRLENALILSGNVIGKTSSELETLAETVGETTGHFSESREAVEALASSGIIAGGQLQGALKGVVAGLEITGRSIDELVGDFEKIAKDPVKSIVNLNEKYNFLTLDVYKQIKALEEQGKHVEAIKLATDTYADALDKKSKESVKNLGYVETAWRDLKKTASEFKDFLLGIGRDDTNDELLADAQKRLAGFKLSKESIVSSTDKKIVAQIDAGLKQAQIDVNFLSAKIKFESENAQKNSNKLNDDKSKIQAAEAASKNRPTKTTDPLTSDRNALAELQRENELLVQGISLQDAQTIAKLEAKGANQTLILSVLDANEAQANYIKSVKDAEEASKTKLKALQDEINFETELKQVAEQRVLEQEQAAAKLQKQKEETFDSLNDQYLKANQEIDADLITSDVKREKRRAEIAHEYALKRIENEKLTAEQTALLREKEAENYEKTLQKIEQQSTQTRNLGQDLGLTFASTFETAIERGDSFGDLIGSLGQDIERVITRMLVIEPLIRNMKNAIEDVGGASGIFGAIGEFFGLGGGSSGGGGDTNYVDGIAIVGEVADNLASGFHTGGIAGGKPTFTRNVNPAIFDTAPRYHTGGIAGDEVPSILRKGEGVFTQEQMRNLAPTGGGGNVQVNLIEAPNSARAGQVETSQDGNNNQILNVFVDKIRASLNNDITRGTGIAGALESTYGLNRAAGAR